MTVGGIGWLVGLFAGSSILFWLPRTALRQTGLALLNLGFVALFIPDLSSGLLLAAFLISGWLAATLFLANRSRSLMALYLLLLILFFLWIKKYAFLAWFVPLSPFQSGLVLIGISYLLFRQIHLVVDCFQGQVERVSFWDYLNYQLNLFGFLAGPIQRFQEFQLSWNNLSPLCERADEVLAAYIRVFLGVIKVSLIAEFFLGKYDRWSNALLSGSTLGFETPGKAAWKALLLFYCYPCYIYFNFSGYCDVVIGSAKLVGLHMPENFDKPFLSRNMIDYWTRWHRTLGLWIRDYLFTPLYKFVAQRWPARAASLAILCYFIALFLTGIWHGATWNFVVFGLLNGLGVSVAKLWENYLVAKRGRKGFKAYLQSKPIRVIAIVTTLHYVCFTIWFFPVGLSRDIELLKRVAQTMKALF